MAVTPTTFEGYLKYIEGKLANTLPNFAKLQASIPFDNAKRLGRKFIYPVILRAPQGFTHAKTGTSAKSVYTLNDPVTAQMEEVEIEGKELFGQEDIAIGMLKSAMGEGQAHGAVVPQVLTMLREQALFMLELELLYGRSATGIGAVEERTDDSGTTQTFKITKATWAAGIWARLEGAYLDCYDDDGDPQRNTAGTVLVSGVDPAARTITVTGTESELDTIVADDFFTPRGWYGTTAVTAAANNFYGLEATLAHTSGTLHGVSATTYSLWKGNRASAGSAKATFKKLLDVDAYAATRGATDDMDALINNFVWNDIANDAMLLRQLGSESRREVDLGTDKITVIANGRKLSLVPHPMVKCGHILGYVPSKFKRIGASELVSLWNAEDMMHLETKSGVRFRNFYDQALAPLEGPSRGFELHSIVPEGLA